jgi:tetrahydromethanopterin S-methyltransferase subunit C
MCKDTSGIVAYVVAGAAVGYVFMPTLAPALISPNLGALAGGIVGYLYLNRKDCGGGKARRQ